MVERSLAQVIEIRASIVALNDEDLLDLADIFSGQTGTLIEVTASAELNNRGLSLQEPNGD